ncbi:FAD-dependent oxidoreductase [Thermus caliditerrae]|uniref:FAD-dependent oxidoreductase n=1 Tax=Thermus caliditerrae TaxID=1330700 RepID=UPI001F344781|nr:FAD-dependent oxidoreductase [Thermus caliditerrae]
MRTWLAFLLFFGLGLAQYDLVVYGATPQGVTAAVAAAQEGLKVLLLEPGRGVGGVLTQGWLATLDLAKDKEGLLQRGLFLDFYRRIGEEASFDVKRAEEALLAMLREAGVELRLEAPLDRVEVDGGTVVALATPGGLFQAPYFVDATDTAELAFRAGAGFTLGREDTGLDRRSMAATLVFRLEGVPWGAVFLALNYEGQVRRTGAGAWGRSGWGFGELVRGYVPSDPSRYALRGLNLSRQDDGSLLVNALLLFGVEGADPLSLERKRVEAALEAERVVAYLRGKDPLLFGTAHLAGVAPKYPVVAQATTGYLKGSLGLSEPVLLGDFLANLEHYYRAKGPEERLRVVLKARELFREELQKPLKRLTLNQLLQALGEGRLSGADPVTRGEAALLLYRLLP